MLMQVEGSKAVADAVALCRPDVISAYPISPQTHIVEELSRIVKGGELGRCEYLNVESEFAAMSAAIGASAAGARTYTATASQGLLFMVEAVYNAAGLGLPIVMTVANRAIGAPINIWNDHSDSMSQRDSGWVQLYADSNQAAVDLHILAYRLGEQLSLPVMVCMDGFVLTHAFERIDMPAHEQVDRFLPPFEPRQLLDPDHPISIGAMVGPEAFTEVRYAQHLRHLEVLEELPQLAREFADVFGRDSGDILRPYRTDGAETIVVALGSVLGTISDVVDELRADGHAVGSLGITCFRPWPDAAVRAALATARRVIVIDRAFQMGVGSIVGAEVRLALARSTATAGIEVHEVIAGLGGRPITRASLQALVAGALVGELEQLTFLDLDEELLGLALRSGRPGAAPVPSVHDGEEASR